MKKTLVLLAFAAFCFTSADAQKQIGGDITIEFEFTPLGNSPINNYGVRGRLFTSENMAIRGQINYGSSTVRTVHGNEMVMPFWLPDYIDPVFPNGQPNTEPFLAPEEQQLNPELHHIVKSSSFGIMPGVEIHMDGTDNLSPYVGGVIDFASGTNSLEIERWGPNDIDNTVDYEKFIKWSETLTDTWSRFGIGAVLGFDWYFVDNCYLGAEMTVGFNSQNNKDIVYTVSDDVAYSLHYSSNADDNVDLSPNWIQGDMSSFGMMAQGSIRLGCIFKQ